VNQISSWAVSNPIPKLAHVLVTNMLPNVLAQTCGTSKSGKQAPMMLDGWKHHAPNQFVHCDIVDTRRKYEHKRGVGLEAFPQALVNAMRCEVLSG